MLALLSHPKLNPEDSQGVISDTKSLHCSQALERGLISVNDVKDGDGFCQICMGACGL